MDLKVVEGGGKEGEDWCLVPSFLPPPKYYCYVANNPSIFRYLLIFLFLFSWKKRGKDKHFRGDRDTEMIFA